MLTGLFCVRNGSGPTVAEGWLAELWRARLGGSIGLREELGVRLIRLLLATLSAVPIAACATVERPVESGLISPAEAIQGAAAAAPRTLPGRFALRVRAVGSQDGNVYLNSEEDYRDQRNLTVAIRPSALPHLRARFGDLDRLIGRDIVVRGAARRVRIDFIAAGQPTGKYYFQTHVDVGSADQVSIAEASFIPRARGR